MRPFKGTLTAIALVLATGFLCALPADAAQEFDSVHKEFMSWAKRSLHPVADRDLYETTKDLKPMLKIVGDARLVALSESVHGAAEPLQFRNRLFKFLIEDLGFNAIAIESGIVESRALDEYVVHDVGDFESVMKRGFSWGFENFKANRELIRWLHDYNSHRTTDASKVHVFGFDVSGSPGNLSVLRGPDTAFRAALEYLEAVDAKAAGDIRARVGNALPALMKTNEYGGLQQSERDSLTSAIADAISLLERNKFSYIAKSSTRDHEWGLRAAIGARQVDAWIRVMPIGWKISDGLDWTNDATRNRDRSMLENIQSILDQLGPHSRVLVYAAVAHTASTPIQFPAASAESVPFGVHLKERFGAGVIGIHNMSVGGDIAYCSVGGRGASAQLKPPPESSLQSIFGLLNQHQYVLDLRHAPARVTQWLRETQDDWNGFGVTRMPVARAFDAVYYVSPVTSACAQ